MSTVSNTGFSSGSRRTETTSAARSRGQQSSQRQLLTAASQPLSWFLSTDVACEPALAPGSSPLQIGYIATVKGADFLRALRRCVQLSTGDRTQYVLNEVTCPTGYAVEAILGYVR